MVGRWAAHAERIRRLAARIRDDGSVLAWLMGRGQGQRELHMWGESHMYPGPGSLPLHTESDRREKQEHGGGVCPARRDGAGMTVG
jgi:hypothetical protein